MHRVIIKLEKEKEDGIDVFVRPAQLVYGGASSSYP